MRLLTAVGVTAAGCAVALGSPALAAGASSASSTPAPPPSASPGWRGEGRSQLSGRHEVPGPGDRDGYGRFTYSIKGRALCYDLSVRKVDQPNAAHIHHGRPGVAGPIVIALRTPAKGDSHGCVTAVPDRRQNRGNAASVLTYAELGDIVRHPKGYYVNVHNKRYPNGAIRGQF